MNVREILKLVSEQGVGLEEPTDIDNTVYLRYLNLVHFDLYRSVASINPFAKIEEKEGNAVAGKLELGSTPFLVRSVYIPIKNNAQILRSISYDEILKTDPAMDASGKPERWFFLNNNIQLYPKSHTGTVKVVYMDDPKEFTIGTLSEQIPYPTIYHQVLVDGTIYYLFQGEGGLKNKQELALSLARWEKGKKALYAYLMGQSGEHLSTYSEV